MGQTKTKKTQGQISIDLAQISFGKNLAFLPQRNPTFPDKNSFLSDHFFF